jgi:hypothetical protein
MNKADNLFNIQPSKQLNLSPLKLYITLDLTRGWINIKINLHFRLKLISALNYRLSALHAWK